jgi:hypothetical protein
MRSRPAGLSKIVAWKRWSPMAIWIFICSSWWGEAVGELGAFWALPDDGEVDGAPPGVSPDRPL